MTLTAERLREVLRYDPLTGIFTWRVRASYGIHIGDVAGHHHNRGYVHIAIDGCRYRAHRLAWLYMTGAWPTSLIDHKNTIRHENWWNNLRIASTSENAQNQRCANRDNVCGLLGVSKHYKRWQARIKVDGKKIHIGTFDTPELAHDAYLKAKAALHPFQTLTDLSK